MKRPEPMILLPDSRGVYIPRDFARAWIDRTVSVANVRDEEWAILESGPDNRDYWDTWLEVCRYAIVADINGVSYTLSQDGDLWLIPVGMKWNEKTESYQWPDNNVVPFKRKEQR